MDTPRTSNRGLSALVLAGLLLAVVGAIWLIVLARSTSDNASDPTQTEPEGIDIPVAEDPQRTGTPVTERLLLEFDLETGSTEFSAIALNEDADRVMIADDEDRLFEFDIAADNSLVLPPRRSIQVAVGGGDIEGIAWMTGNTYVLAHENDGNLTVVEFGDDVARITDEHLRRVIDTGIREIDGNGLEGVAYLGADGVAEFAVVDERPPTIVLIDGLGGIVQSTRVDLGVPDLSDIARARNGRLSVLSDEGRVVIDLWLEANGDTVVHNTIDLVFPEGRFEQPEGLVRSLDGTRLYVVGEAPGTRRFVFGSWR